MKPATKTLAGRSYSSVGAASFRLRAEPVPDQTFLFFHGRDQVQLPFGGGFLCTTGELIRIGAPQIASAQLAEILFDPAAHGIAPGDTRNFQCWFRDPQGGAQTFSTSDAVEVSFVD